MDYKFFAVINMRELFDCLFFDKSRDMTQYKISIYKFF